MIDRETVRERAYQLWEAAGKPEGRHEWSWHEAERQLREEQLNHETKTPDNL